MNAFLPVSSSTTQRLVFANVACLFLFIWGAHGATLIRWELAAGGNGHLYGITDTESDWMAAEALSVSLGGHLASITTPAEQAFIINTFLNGALDARPLWVGLTDTVPYGGGAGSKVYSTWTTGEPVSYSDWYPGEPNNHYLGEDFGTINWVRSLDPAAAKGTWNDVPLNGTTVYGGNTNGPYFGLIEIAGPVPEPCSTVLAVAGLGVLLGVRRRM